MAGRHSLRATETDGIRDRDDAEMHARLEEIRQGAIKNERMRQAGTDILAASDGRFVVVDEIGAGGMGAVYLAQDTQSIDPETNDFRLVAVKLPFGNSSDEHYRRFRRNEIGDAHRAGSIEGIPTVIEASTMSDPPYIATEWIQGRNLQQVIAQDGPMSEERALDIGVQVAGIVAQLHAKGLVHRDIKPANIILKDDGKVVLTDLGIGWEYERTVRTDPNMSMGSPNRMAPEQFAGRAPNFAAAAALDSWAVGLLMEFCKEGKLPAAHVQSHEGPNGDAEQKKIFYAAIDRQVEHGAHKLPANTPFERLRSDLLQLDPRKRLALADVSSRARDIYYGNVPENVAPDGFTRGSHRRSSQSKFVQAVSGIFSASRHRRPEPRHRASGESVKLEPTCANPSFAEMSTEQIAALAESVSANELLARLNNPVGDRRAFEETTGEFRSSSHAESQLLSGSSGGAQIPDNELTTRTLQRDLSIGN